MEREDKQNQHIAVLQDNYKTMSEQLKEVVRGVSDIQVTLAGLPQKILNSADERYASKDSEKRLNALETRIESRSYDWLKQFAITLITIVIGFSIYSQLN